MIQQGRLDHNIFSLRLSDSYHNISGDLRFGSTNTDLYVEPLHTFPVSKVFRTDPESVAGYFLAPSWQVPVHSLSHGVLSASLNSERPKLSNFSLKGYTAVFSSTFLFIALPDEILEDILAKTGASNDHMVDCDMRDSQPSLVFNLARGGDYVSFTLSPHDYTRRSPNTDFFPNKKRCQVCVSVLHLETSDAKYIILGSVFLAR